MFSLKISLRAMRGLNLLRQHEFPQAVDCKQRSDFFGQFYLRRKTFQFFTRVVQLVFFKCSRF